MNTFKPSEKSKIQFSIATGIKIESKESTTIKFKPTEVKSSPKSYRIIGKKNKSSKKIHVFNQE